MACCHITQSSGTARGCRSSVPSSAKPNHTSACIQSNQARITTDVIVRLHVHRSGSRNLFLTSCMLDLLQRDVEPAVNLGDVHCYARLPVLNVSSGSRPGAGHGRRPGGKIVVTRPSGHFRFASHICTSGSGGKVSGYKKDQLRVTPQVLNRF